MLRHDHRPPPLPGGLPGLLGGRAPLVLILAYYFAPGPNYSRLDDGLYQGGGRATSLPGTRAFVNL
ncbi:MAG TPA: hypothetical protein VFA26_25805 [Gemmataceae bacterium]|nr:hypothetical protein [Gemmataceae bacterium]